MKAIDILLEEHKLIDEMVDLLDSSVERATSPEGLSPDVISQEIEICRDFIGRCHEVKEEQILVPPLQERGFPRDRGPISDLIEEHKKGRTILRRLAATETLEQPGEQLEAFAKLAAAYSMYLYEQTREEEKRIYAAARSAIDENAAESMYHRCIELDEELLGAAGREKYLNMIGDLKALLR